MGMALSRPFSTQCPHRPPQEDVGILWSSSTLFPPQQAAGSSSSCRGRIPASHRVRGSIGMWVLLSITILFISIGLRRVMCRSSSRIHGPGPQISGEGIRGRRQQPTVAADIELVQQPPAPAPALALAPECGWAQQTCSVCLSELADGDMVRVLMVCRHCFHTACIEPWLREHDTCPLCRAPTTARQGSRNMVT